MWLLSPCTWQHIRRSDAAIRYHAVLCIGVQRRLDFHCGGQLPMQPTWGTSALKRYALPAMNVSSPLFMLDFLAAPVAVLPLVPASIRVVSVELAAWTMGAMPCRVSVPGHASIVYNPGATLLVIEASQHTDASRNYRSHVTQRLLTSACKWFLCPQYGRRSCPYP